MPVRLFGTATTKISRGHDRCKSRVGSNSRNETTYRHHRLPASTETAIFTYHLKKWPYLCVLSTHCTTLTTSRRL